MAYESFSSSFHTEKIILIVKCQPRECALLGFIIRVDVIFSKCDGFQLVLFI